MSDSMPIDDAFIDIIDAQKKEPQWVVANLLPVGLTFLAGPPKVSHKSTISLALAAMCARWQARTLPPWMDCLLGGPSMIFSYEADAGEIRSMMEDGLGLTPERGAMYIATDPWSFQLDQEGGPQALVEYMDRKKPRLVVMDPFRNMWSGDENDSGQVIQALGPVQRWLKNNEAAGIVAHHVNKPIADGPNQAGGMFTMRGSSAIPGLADGILVVEPGNQEGVITIHTKFKRGPSWKRRIQIGAPGYGWPSAGYEILPDLALAMRDEWQNRRAGGDTLQWLADVSGRLKQQTAAIRSALAALDRNMLLGNMSMDDRRLLIPEVH